MAGETLEAKLQTMWNRRWRPVIYAGLAIVVVWAGAVTGYRYLQSLKMTAEKVQAYVSGTDLRSLTGEQRRKAIEELARRINALSMEERRKARLERAAWGWFDAMTDAEKSWFVDQTMPTGFKQMITSFEDMPEDKRKRAIDDALRSLREARNRIASAQGEGDMSQIDTNAPPISKELEAQIRTIGLRTFYSQSSAQTKAEVAPVLEELQRVMESGRTLHGERMHR